ncbi:MAG: hypothetical protein VW338_01610 [Rhodospirillaceae bacterium]
MHAAEADAAKVSLDAILLVGARSSLGELRAQPFFKSGRTV